MTPRILLGLLCLALSFQDCMRVHQFGHLVQPCAHAAGIGSRKFGRLVRQLSCNACDGSKTWHSELCKQKKVAWQRGCACLFLYFLLLSCCLTWAYARSKGLKVLPTAVSGPFQLPKGSRVGLSGLKRSPKAGDQIGTKKGARTGRNTSGSDRFMSVPLRLATTTDWEWETSVDLSGW